MARISQEQILANPAREYLLNRKSRHVAVTSARQMPVTRSAQALRLAELRPLGCDAAART